MSDGPALSADRSFWGVTSTQFLGAFNDNVFKQVLLLLFVAVPRRDGTSVDLQPLALLMFALPFVLFSGYAGFLSDRYPKDRVIVVCKVAELAIMVLGIGAFWFVASAGLSSVVICVLTVVLFLMGTQSAFFGPSKYGILPELFVERRLPAANGALLMTTFVAIILGSAFAGLLTQHFNQQLWIVGVVCAGIALMGIATAIWIRHLRAADQELQFHADSLWIPKQLRHLLANDRSLLEAVVVTSIFWTVAALVQPAVNALGRVQLGESYSRTSLLVTTISLGIAAGSLIAGWLSNDRVDWRLLRVGGIGIVASLLALAPASRGAHWLGYHGSLLTLTLLGLFTGLFAIPLQVFLQSRPPMELKGRMIATQNLLNWVGILLSAFLYAVMGRLATLMGWPQSSVFAMTAMLMLPIVLWYRPERRQA